MLVNIPSPRIGVGVVGLGRVGRNLVRRIDQHPQLELRGIADAAKPEALAYLLRFDTLLGRLEDPVTIDPLGALRWGAHDVRLVSREEPGEIPWGEMGVDVVIETRSPRAGARTRSSLERHFAAGAKRVVLCVPSAEAPDVTIVPGIGDDVLRPVHRLVSNASCTAHAVAPVLAALEREFGVDRAFLSTVHSYTDQQHLADVPAADWRAGRAASENIVPLPAHSAELLIGLLPQLAGRLTSSSFNVPVPNGSVADLSIWHQRPVTIEDLHRVVREAADASQGRLAFEDQPIVSSDVLLASASGTFDSAATMVMAGRVSKTLTWFDDGWAYADRALELAARLGAFDLAAPDGGAR